MEPGLGILFVSAAGARTNRVAETAQAGVPPSFDKVRKQAKAGWSVERMRRETGASPEQRKIFYLQLYKALF